MVDNNLIQFNHLNTERTILGDIINQRDADIERLLNSPISRLSPKSSE
jgi:hypothetical protein